MPSVSFVTTLKFIGLRAINHTSLVLGVLILFCLLTSNRARAEVVIIEAPNNEWQQIAVPAMRMLPTPQSLFQPYLADLEYGIDWTIFTYGADVGYVEPEADDFLEPGRAVWFIQNSGDSISLEIDIDGEIWSATETDACSVELGCIELEINQGNFESTWIMAGSPFSGPIAVEEIRFQASQDADACLTGCTVGEVATAGLGDSRLYTYNSAQNRYIEFQGADQLNPLQGFWYGTYTSISDDLPSLHLPWKNGDATSIQASLDTRSNSNSFGSFTVDGGTKIMMLGERSDEGLPQTIGQLSISDDAFSSGQVVMQQYDDQGRLISHIDPIAGQLTVVYLDAAQRYRMTWYLPTGERINEVFDLPPGSILSRDNAASSSIARSEFANLDTADTPGFMAGAINGQVAAFCPQEGLAIEDAEIILVGERFPNGFGEPSIVEPIRYARLDNTGVYGYSVSSGYVQTPLSSNAEKANDVIDAACAGSTALSSDLKKRNKSAQSLISKVVSVPARKVKDLATVLTTGIDAVCTLKEFKDRISFAKADSSGALRIVARAYRPPFGGGESEQWNVFPDTLEVPFKSIVLKDEACPKFSIEIQSIRCESGYLAPNSFTRAMHYTITGIATSTDQTGGSPALVSAKPDRTFGYYTVDEHLISSCSSWSGTQIYGDNVTYNYCRKNKADPDTTLWRTQHRSSIYGPSTIEAKLYGYSFYKVYARDTIDVPACPGFFNCIDGVCR